MKLSVIIVNYNVVYFLEQCLKSTAAAQRHFENEFGAESMDIWVVDNNSMDGSVEMVKNRFPEVKLMANKQNTGFSKANNQAITESTAEYALLLNPDTLVEEDTFTKCIRFMDAHPEAGGLGVKMIDGKGFFLPESKRGLPTPWVAFYKVFGFAKLFPHSRKFGKYHLTYLSKDEIHDVDILSGAFMMLRKAALDKAGLLDETFFMYGEDIDLSYRLQLAGYRNYYFPETQIIHYKGESTKKSSVNYVFVFYRAMIIFARKHFSGKNARVFSFFIHLAIYLRAALAIVRRFIYRWAHPLADAAIIYGGLVLLKEYWEEYQTYTSGGSYPELVTYGILPAYTCIWILSVMISGGYRLPFRSIKAIRGVVTGTVFILVVYALLNENLRFSRALILLGAAYSVAGMLFTRFIIHLIRYKNIRFEAAGRKKTAIVGSDEECKRIHQLILSTGNSADITGFVLVSGAKDENGNVKILGDINALDQVVTIYNLDELIFCGKDVNAAAIMRYMALFKDNGLDYKIAPEGSNFVIGSNSIHRMGELYVTDINALTRPSNMRKKRLFDVTATIILMMTLPLNIWFVDRKIAYIHHLIRVITGKRTWVGLHPSDTSLRVAKLRKGILNPTDAIRVPVNDPVTIENLDLIYVNDYKVEVDAGIILKSFSLLGRT